MNVDGAQTVYGITLNSLIPNFRKNGVVMNEHVKEVQSLARGFLPKKINLPRTNPGHSLWMPFGKDKKNSAQLEQQAPAASALEIALEKFRKAAN